MFRKMSSINVRSKVQNLMKAGIKRRRFDETSITEQSSFQPDEESGEEETAIIDDEFVESEGSGDENVEPEMVEFVIGKTNKGTKCLWHAGQNF